MKRIVLFTAIASMLALTTRATPNAPKPFHLTPVTNLNALKTPPEPFKDLIVTEHTETFYNECAGEMLEFTFTEYYRISWIQNGKRDNSAVSVRFFGTAVGLTTGTRYLMRQHSTDVINVSRHNDQVSWNGNTKYNLISLGGDKNFSIQFNYTWIVNAKGEVTLEDFEENDTSCK